MIQLALEIPKVHLKDLSPLTDLDFILAQDVLSDSDVADYFSMSTRISILDNGVHETGMPMSPLEIFEAAKRCNPTYITTPDFFHDAKKTYEGFCQLEDINKGRFKLAFCLQGDLPEERLHLMSAIEARYQMLCLPFRFSRLEWFKDLLHRLPRTYKWPSKFHLFGVSTLDELTNWTIFLRNKPELIGRFSVDTCKPLKFGYSKTLFTPDLNLRGSQRHSEVMTPDQMRASLYNICFLRKYL